MLKLARSKPLYVQQGPRAVLLLHGFTGTPQDVKKIAPILLEQGYSCYAPIYRGHGLGAEALILTTPQQWWQDALSALQFLTAQGYQDIVVIGHSMGGIFTLRLAQMLAQPACLLGYPALSQINLAGIVTLCTPVQSRPFDELSQRLFRYARQYKQLQQKQAQQINFEIQQLAAKDLQMLNQISELSSQAAHDLALIKVPTLVIQGEQDAPSYQHSARRIFAGVSTPKKYLQRYAHSGHLIMYGPDLPQVQRDIARFLQSVDW